MGKLKILLEIQSYNTHWWHCKCINSSPFVDSYVLGWLTGSYIEMVVFKGTMEDNLNFFIWWCSRLAGGSINFHWSLEASNYRGGIIKINRLFHQTMVLDAAAVHLRTLGGNGRFWKALFHVSNSLNWMVDKLQRQENASSKPTYPVPSLILFS